MCRWISIFLVGTAIACGGSEGAGFDAGTEIDGGSPAGDAGTQSDAGYAADGGSTSDGGYTADGGSTADGGDTADGGSTTDGGAACPPGIVCVHELPFHDEGDTSTAPNRSFSRYACAPGTNEGGPEVVYRIVVTEPGLLGARVRDDSFTDIDLHILSDLDPAACLGRNDAALSRYVGPGTYYVVADTYVDSSGIERVGRYSLDITFRPVPEIACEMSTEPLPRVQGDVLQMPATGPVVAEAHLVTPSEPFDGGWPTSGTDGIQRHYALSEAASGHLMNRRDSWAPAGEGGSMWGQGSTSKPPLEHEAWYVNMYWRNRPARATRMIIRQPDGGLGVVAAAGYETGPGSPTAIGGASEEIHDVLGTLHRSTLTMGFAIDQTLPFGPIRCAP